MKREIKFRAWEKNSNNMWDVRELEWAAGEILTAYLGLHTNHADDLEIMQYTGLTDFYGDEIYEGDIVGLHPHCSFEEDITKLKLEAVSWNPERCDYDGIYPSLRYWNHHQIVGNIYENPELLKQVGWQDTLGGTPGC